MRRDFYNNEGREAEGMPLLSQIKLIKVISSFTASNIIHFFNPSLFHLSSGKKIMRKKERMKRFEEEKRLFMFNDVKTNH